MMRCAATARRATLHGMIWAIAAGLLAVACSDSSTPKVDPPPLAGLTHPEMARVGDAVAFASASVVGLTDGVAEHPLTRFRFTFADGSAVVEQAQATTTHTFAAAGSYAVALTITDTRGLTSTVQSTIQIVADYTATCTEGSPDGCSSGLCSGDVCAVAACVGDEICKFLGAQGNPTCQAGVCVRTELPPLPDVWVDLDAYDTADDATATDAADDATPTDVEDASDVAVLSDAITAVDAQGDADSEVSADPCDPNPCPPFNPLCINNNGVAKCECEFGVTCEPVCVPPLEPPKPQVNLLVGDLIISEIMIKPAQSTDDVGEWFEVVNVSNPPKKIQLNGLMITDKSGADGHVINHCKDLFLQPGDAFVFARSGDPTKNGGFTPGYVYGDDVSFGNTADSLYLRAVYASGGGTVNLDIDKLVWSTDWPVNGSSGHAFALDPNKIAEKSDPASWCGSQVPMSNGDYGSPGVLNPACP